MDRAGVVFEVDPNDVISKTTNEMADQLSPQSLNLSRKRKAPAKSSACILM